MESEVRGFGRVPSRRWGVATGADAGRGPWRASGCTTARSRVVLDAIAGPRPSAGSRAGVASARVAPSRRGAGAWWRLFLLAWCALMSSTVRASAMGAGFRCIDPAPSCACGSSPGIAVPEGSAPGCAERDDAERGGAVVRASAARAPQEQEVDRLRAQVDAWLAAPRDWEGLSEAGARRFGVDLDAVFARAGGAARDELALRLTSLAGRFEGDPVMGGFAARGRRLLEGELVGPRATAVEVWLLTRVVAPPLGARTVGAFRPSLDERRQGITLLEAAGVQQLRTALLTVARRRDDPLRSAALTVLGSWSAAHGVDEGVDGFLVELLGEPFDVGSSPHPFNLILDRIRGGGPPLGERARARLQARVAAMILSADWREVARAIRLSEGFPLDERVPLLLDALSVWHQRELSGRPVEHLARAQGDLVRTLRELSGRFHDARPEPWIQWWIQVRQGSLPRPGSAEFEADRRRRAKEPRSTATFFGIRPESDRVLFVIDASGSMATGFGTSGRTRYQEAVEQMMRFLQGAPDGTRFGVILFSGEPRSTGDRLHGVDPKTLERVRLELLAHEPGGGTRLRPAVERALALDGRGLPDLERLEADTIIVLCDGETDEGWGWVAPTLGRVLPHHPVVFHCVHLGGRSDGTLQALASSSGGTFLRVGG